MGIFAKTIVHNMNSRSVITVGEAVEGGAMLQVDELVQLVFPDHQNSSGLHELQGWLQTALELCNESIEKVEELDDEKRKNRTLLDDVADACVLDPNVTVSGDE